MVVINMFVVMALSVKNKVLELLEKLQKYKSFYHSNSFNVPLYLNCKKKTA